MGSVKLETKSQGRGNHQWDVVSLNSIEVIEVLIKYRSKFDSSYISKALYDNNPFVSNGIPDFVEIITCLYVDLDMYIKNANLFKLELFIIKKFMFGYNISDIAYFVNKKFNKNYRTTDIGQIFKNSCRKIQNEYLYQYNETLYLNETIKANKSDVYILCSTCRKPYLKNKKNFCISREYQDNIKPLCRNCKSRSASKIKKI